MGGRQPEDLGVHTGFPQLPPVLSVQTRQGQVIWPSRWGGECGPPAARMATWQPPHLASGNPELIPTRDPQAWFAQNWQRLSPQAAFLPRTCPSCGTRGSHRVGDLTTLASCRAFRGVLGSGVIREAGREGL